MDTMARKGPAGGLQVLGVDGFPQHIIIERDYIILCERGRVVSNLATSKKAYKFMSRSYATQR